MKLIIEDDIMSLTNEQRHEIAIEIAEFWKYNCQDEEFYDNCQDSVYEELANWYELDDNDFHKEYQAILNLIDELYSYNNWEARLFFEKSDTIITQNNYVVINDIYFQNVWFIKKIGNEISLQNENEDEIAFISYSEIKNIKVVY